VRGCFCTYCTYCLPFIKYAAAKLFKLFELFLKNSARMPSKNQGLGTRN